jgi:hypothetical protein
MASLISQLLPWAVLGSNILAAVLLSALIFRKSWGRDIVYWVGTHAIPLGLFLSVAAVFGSLFYSNIIGFEPCYLCWWQRIAIFPLLPLFAIGAYRKDRGVFKYSLPLALIAVVLSIYHSYIQWGGNPLIPCPATSTCDKLFVYEFGYITIPTMVLSVAVLYVLLYIANRVHKSN